MTRLTPFLVAAMALAGGTVHAKPATTTAPAAATTAKANVAPSHRGPSTRVIAILDVRVGSGVPPEIAAQFQHDLNKQIDPMHFWLAPNQKVRAAMMNSTKWTDGCLVGKCLSEVKTQTNADFALLAALTGSGTSFGSVITLVRTDTGQVVAQDTEHCDVCTLDEALAKAEHATVKLLEGLPNKLPPAAQGAATPAGPPQTLAQRYVTLQHRDHHHKIVGMTLTVTGLVATAVGLALYQANSQDNGMLAVAAAGAGLAVGGIIVLKF